MIGGHTHHALQTPEKIGRTAIVQAGHRGPWLGRLRLIRSAHGGWTVTDAALLPVTRSVSEDAEVVSVLERFRQEAEDNLAEVVAVLSHPIPHALEGPAPVVEALAQLVHQELKPYVTLLNTGLVTGEIPEMPVTRRALVQHCPSVVNPVTLDLTGAQLRVGLAQVQSGTGVYEPIRAGARGKYVGALIVVGAPSHIREEAIYRVATVSPLALGFSPYRELGRGRNVRWEMGRTVRDSLAETLRAWDPYRGGTR